MIGQRTLYYRCLDCGIEYDNITHNEEGVEIHNERTSCTACRSNHLEQLSNTPEWAIRRMGI